MRDVTNTSGAWRPNTERLANGLKPTIGTKVFRPIIVSTLFVWESVQSSLIATWRLCKESIRFLCRQIKMVKPKLLEFYWWLAKSFWTQKGYMLELISSETTLTTWFCSHRWLQSRNFWILLCIMHHILFKWRKVCRKKS